MQLVQLHFLFLKFHEQIKPTESQQSLFWCTFSLNIMTHISIQNPKHLFHSSVCLWTYRVNFKTHHFDSLNKRFYIRHTFFNGFNNSISYETLEHRTSLKSRGYICSDSQQYIVWCKLIDFSFMPKIIRILRKNHVSWRYFVNVQL